MPRVSRAPPVSLRLREVFGADYAEAARTLDQSEAARRQLGRPLVLGPGESPRDVL